MNTTIDNKLSAHFSDLIHDGHTEQVAQLLAQHPEYITHDFGMGTLLFDAVMLGNTEMAIMMVQSGFSVDYKYNFGKDGLAGDTPLGTAVSQDDPDMVKCLLVLGADPAVDSVNQLLPVNASLGSKKNSLEMLKHLHAHGCDLNQTFDRRHDNSPMSALSMAMEYGKDDVVAFLKSIGCTLPQGA